MISLAADAEGGGIVGNCDLLSVEGAIKRQQTQDNTRIVGIAGNRSPTAA